MAEMSLKQGQQKSVGANQYADATTIFASASIKEYVRNFYLPHKNK